MGRWSSVHLDLRVEQLASDVAAELHKTYRAVAARLEAEDFCGADPYDALNSRLFARSPFASLPLARLVWQQLFRRSPFDFRRVSGVAPTTNPVALALAARTYERAGEVDKCRRAVERLLAMRCDPAQYGDGMWGYPFPWQAKAFYIPRGTPNIIATAYAVRALDQCAPRLSLDVDPIIADTARFVAKELVRKADGKNRRYLAYATGSDAMVHNASLWGAYVLALAAQRGGPAEWKELAEAAIEYSLRAQSPDGAWVYGESAHHRWTDGFHTGYVLEALHLCRFLLKRDDLAEPVSRGTKYYLDTFLRADGVVPYYSDGSGPLDANNFAQMVITLDLLKPRCDWDSLADKVLIAAIRALWCERSSAFAYQRSNARINRAFYPRWTQIWMMHSLGLRLWFREHDLEQRESLFRCKDRLGVC